VVRGHLETRGKAFLLGAAIGTGLAAQAAERGGADFLLALTAGRLRSMGLPSITCLLAVGEANRMVMEFGPAEILAQTSLPVFFGAAALGSEPVEALLERASRAGFRGVTNFPSSVFLDGRYRCYLENCGLGFGCELTMLQAARRRGLATLAYVRTLAEARRAAAAEVDMVNLNFGWNVGGLLGMRGTLGLDEAANLGSTVVAAVRAINPTIRCLIEGGPIVTPEQMERVCRDSGADGYIGGSTIDRLPLENAIEMATDAFKTVGVLRRQVEALESKLHRRAVIDALMGQSESLEHARGQFARAVDSDLPVLIVGEEGTGRRALAQALHETRIRNGRWIVRVDCRTQPAEVVDAQLLGCGALLQRARGSTLVLEHVEALDGTLQGKLLRAFRAGGGDRPPVRFIGISGPTRFVAGGAGFDNGLLRWLATIRIELPPLREHLEDLPMLAAALLRKVDKNRCKGLAPSAYRELLGYHWPRNLDELRTVIQTASLKARGAQIVAADVTAELGSPADMGRDRDSFASERDWILEGLRRNRFRRAETARFLRISRKTLYNKMQQHGLTRLPILTHPLE
jgi:predicted TIM-barrel enzyme/transcriptional regulator with AAA-type ATPase domain